jgi:hypothetical protein
MDNPILKDILEKAKDGLGKKNRPKHGMRSTHIAHHANGSHTVTHTPHEMGDETSYAVADTGELASKIKEYLGDKEAPEGPGMKIAGPEESMEKV